MICKPHLSGPSLAPNSLIRKAKQWTPWGGATITHICFMHVIVDGSSPRLLSLHFAYPIAKLARIVCVTLGDSYSFLPSPSMS